MPDIVKLTGLVRSMYSGDMSAITWRRLAEMKPMPLIMEAFDSSFLNHCRQFVADRVERIERVSKMTIKEQCGHYRKLGYFR